MNAGNPSSRAEGVLTGRNEELERYISSPALFESDLVREGVAAI